MTVAAAKRKKRKHAPFEQELNVRNWESNPSAQFPTSQQGSNNRREVLSDWEHAS